MPESVHSQPRVPFAALCLSRKKIVPFPTRLSLSLNHCRVFLQSQSQSHTHTHYVTNVQTKKLLFYIQDAHRRQAITSCVISLSCFPPLCSFATIFTCPFVRKLYLRQLWVQKTLGFVHIHSAILIQEINVADRSLTTSRHVCILAKKVDTKKGDYNWHNWPCTESPCSAWTICHQIVSWSAPPLMGQRHLKSISFQYVMQCNYHSPVSISIQVQAGP